MGLVTGRRVRLLSDTSRIGRRCEPAPAGFGLERPTGVAHALATDWNRLVLIDSLINIAEVPITCSQGDF